MIRRVFPAVLFALGSCGALCQTNSNPVATVECDNLQVNSGTINPLTGQLLVPLAAPPNKVIVTSNAGGLNERLVNSLYFTAPINNVPIANNDAFAIFEDCSAAQALSCATPCLTSGSPDYPRVLIPG